MCITILLNASALPVAIGNIFGSAFTGEGVAGGVIGTMIIGFQRAVFSNEAGIGSAAIAHSSVKTNEPITEWCSWGLYWIFPTRWCF